MTSQPPSSSAPPSSRTMSRWYIDTRPLTSSGTSSLPLLETLQPADQETVRKYYHLADRHMSLASYLLKYLFIHRACRVPWREITISRTPEPHRRPCYIPPSRSSKDGDGECIVPNVEFNVSHQASLVALAGCIIPPSSSAAAASTTILSHMEPNPSASQSTTSTTPQLGIDITCTNEPFRPRRKDSTPRTRKQLADFVDIFSEVFSPRELDAIKTTPIPVSSGSSSSLKEEQEEEEVRYRYRLFYTYWALKEAYIKMTGEALLAPWLRELEFRDVIAPDPIPTTTTTTTTTTGARAGADDNAWGPPYTGIQTFLHGKRVDDVRIEVVAFEKDYLVATAARGAGVGAGTSTSTEETGGADHDPWGEFKRIEIERDVGPCARGECRCVKDLYIKER